MTLCFRVYGGRPYKAAPFSLFLLCGRCRESANFIPLGSR